MTDKFQEQAVREQEVIAAYRWVLGREPEDAAKVSAHVGRSGSVGELRLSFLRSPEFGRALDRLGIRANSTRQAVNSTPKVESSTKLLFLHIPKTAGSSLFQAFEAAVPNHRLCPTRQNVLLTQPLIEFGQYNAFFGHYDCRMADLLPGQPVVLTMLREPRERLVSLYRYLRAHTAERVRVESLALAGIAGESGFVEFLRKARELAPATVDNAYVRTLGGALPLQRWEDRAEHQWLQAHSQDPVLLRSAALDTLTGCAAVGIVEDFAASLAVFNEILGARFGYTLSVPKRTQVTDTLAESSPGFETVLPRAALQGQVEEAADLLDELTVLDQELYEVARSRLNMKRSTSSNDSTTEDN